MNKKRFSILSIITLAVVVLSVVMVNQEPSGVRQELTDQLLISDLVNRVNDVTQIEVSSGKEKVTIKRVKNQWRVSEKHDYLADLPLVKQTILGVANLELVEAKTKKAKNYAKLGVEDPSEANATSSLVTLKDNQDKTLASVIFAKQAPAAHKGSRYVRKADDEQSWLAKGNFEIETGATTWLKADLIDIKTKQIRNITITQPNGDKLTIAKNKPDDKQHTVLGIPNAREIKSQGALNNIAKVLEELTMTDVQPLDSVIFDAKQTVHAEFQTYDGLVITTDAIKQDDKFFIRLNAEFDPDLVQPSTSEDKSSSPSADSTQATKSTEAKASVEATGSTETTASTETTTSTTAIQLAQEKVNKLNAQHADWVYVVTNATGEKLIKKMSDITKAKGTP